MDESKRQRVRRGTRAAWVLEHQGQIFCQCGCGEPIPLKPEHYNVGVPRFMHGHNSRVANPNPRKPAPAPLPCECGCGALATPGKRFISGHNNLGRPASAETRAKLSAAMKARPNPWIGKHPPNYKGGRQIHGQGYIQWTRPEHPFAVGRSRLVMEHRLVMEEYLRATDPTSALLIEIDGHLYLRRDIEIHHVDNDPANNHIENLRPLTKADHARLHMKDGREGFTRVTFAQRSARARKAAATRYRKP